MGPLVDETVAMDADDLVDTIGELIAAVLDRDHGFRMRHVTAIGVGETRHAESLGIMCAAVSVEWRDASRAPVDAHCSRSDAANPSDFNLRCKAERSIPTKAAVREILPPNRVIWASRYCRSKASRASLSGIDMISSPFWLCGVLGAIAPISGGSMSPRMGSLGSPGAMISSRS